MVHHEKSLVPGFFKVSVDHLSGNLESGKVNYCFGKKGWKKPRILDPKICMKRDHYWVAMVCYVTSTFIF